MIKCRSPRLNHMLQTLMRTIQSL